MSEPQITEIASYFATVLPSEADREQTVQAWRHTLRYARKSNTIEPLTAMIREDGAGDATIARYCEELTRS